MKKDLSVTAKELFPDLEKNTYEQLMCSYASDYKTDVNPRLTLKEAIDKYTAPLLNTIENKNNWKNRGESIFVDFSNFLTVFNEFFPLYRADTGVPYMDIGIWNHENGKKVVELLITRIFYNNYIGMNIRDIIFTRENVCSPEIIRIFLRLSD